MTELAPLTLPAADAYHDWVGSSSETALAHARELVTALKASPPDTALATLQAWNEISLALGNASARGELFSEVHPDADVRQTAEQAALAAQQLSTELGLDLEAIAAGNLAKLAARKQNGKLHGSGDLR